MIFLSAKYLSLRFFLLFCLIFGDLCSLASLCSLCIELNYEIFYVVLAEVRHSIDAICFLGTFLQQNAKDL